MVCKNNVQTERLGIFSHCTAIDRWLCVTGIAVPSTTRNLSFLFCRDNALVDCGSLSASLLRTATSATAIQNAVFSFAEGAERLQAINTKSSPAIISLLIHTSIFTRLLATIGDA